MGFGEAMFALAGVQAVNQIGAGYAQRAEANYNSEVLQTQKMLVGVEQGIEYGQYQRLKGKTMGKSMAAIGGMGVMNTGSPMAAMIDAQTQINIDQAIGQFNYEREKSYLQSQADAERRRGKAAVRSGWSNAFGTILQAGSSYAMSSGFGGRDMGGGGVSNRGNIYGSNTPSGTFDMGTYSRIRR
jgi:hypothetical protein